jgi:hypothetical protein
MLISSVIVDAANDSHCGLTLLKRLYPLMQDMHPIPLPAYYSFDFYQGYPYQPTATAMPEILWHAHNPFYDPGPPPEPKPPKEKVNKQNRPSHTDSANSSTAKSAVVTASAAYAGRGRPRFANDTSTVPTQSSDGQASTHIPYGFGRGQRGHMRGNQANRGFRPPSHRLYNPGRSAASSDVVLPN